MKKNEKNWEKKSLLKFGIFLISLVGIAFFDDNLEEAVNEEWKGTKLNQKIFTRESTTYIVFDKSEINEVNCSYFSQIIGTDNSSRQLYNVVGLAINHDPEVKIFDNKLEVLTFLKIHDPIFLLKTP